MLNKRTRLLLAFLLLLVVSSAFSERKIVVPHDFPTIHAALGEAGENDTVYVVKGVYKENVALTDNVVLMGQDMKRTVINGRGKAPCIIGADGAVITGFTITNGSTGILCKNTNPIIEKNIIVDNKGAGIHALISLPQIKNNIIYRNEWTGIFLESVRGTRTSIDHNVILENGYSGVFCAHTTEVLMRNNNFEGNKQFGIFIAPGSKRTRIIYNNFYNNRRNFNKDAIVNKTNMSNEPLYISPSFPEFNFFVKKESQLRKSGEGGADIGLISDEVAATLNTDRDGDGILDDIDQCPDVAEDGDGVEDEDGCPDFDNDGDGINDAEDECKDVAEDLDGFQDKDGCPDEDNDHDGIADKFDNCPDSPETLNEFKDSDGCPDEKPQKITKTVILRGVTFKTASADLLEESYYVLEKIYNSLEAYPDVRVEVGGHTDNQGTGKYNLALSYDRAKAVRNYLIMRGIPANRLTAVGYGEKRPIASNKTPEGQNKNRRVELVPIK